jgi:hypothetical protein
MKMTLNLTYEDGMKVVEAMKNVAIENGWNTEELDGIIEEYCGALDAALAATGISVSIAHEPEDANENKSCDSAADCSFCNSEEEEEEVDDFGVPKDYWSEFDENDDEDKDDDCQYSLTPMGEFVARALAAGLDFEDAVHLASIVFDNSEGE